MLLNPRAELLLKTLIERYIADGQPVGSRTLAKQAGLDVSPATVRNIMADLEELGLIRSPHTSAGRIPTASGYRLFVDTLLTMRPLQAAELKQLEGLRQEEDPHQLIGQASQLLSQITRLAGVVRVPRRDHSAFRQLEFLNLSPGRILVILVTQDGRVHNRVIASDKTFSPSELTQAANYFNETYSGKALAEVKLALLAELQRDSEDMQRLMRLAVEMAQKVFTGDEGEGPDLLVSGESHLLDVPELGEVSKLRRLFEAFNTKRDLLQLLDHSLRAGGVQIFIGQESGYSALEECSVVSASYHANGNLVGTLAVIGPTRMPYERVIPIVDVTARLLSSVLSGAHADPSSAKARQLSA